MSDLLRDDIYADIKYNKRPDFYLKKSKVPLYQPWELELIKHKQSKAICLPWPERKPNYVKFKSETADKIAMSLRPLCFGILFILTIILLAFNDFSNLWWWLGAGVVAPLLVTFSYYTLTQCINESKIKIRNASIPDNISAEVREGVPGAGKTSSLLHDLKILADMMWNKICNKYALLEPFLDDIPYWPQKEREDAKEIIEAYNYYNNGNGYPCLWTSVPCFVDGVPAYRVTADHLLQRTRFPYGAVVMLDETSLILPQELYRNKPYEIIELFKFLRHFGDFKIGSTEQDEDSNVIYLRRVAGASKRMIGQVWVQRPRFLEWIYDFQLNHTKNMTKKKVNYFLIFNKIIRSMGYRKYYYYENAMTLDTVPGLKSFVLKPNLNMTYDDRAYKNAYQCKDVPLVHSSWEHLRLTTQEIKEIFKQELKELGKTKAQQKEEARQRRLAKKEMKNADCN